MISTTLYREPGEDWTKTTYAIARRFDFFREEVAQMTWIKFFYNDAGVVVAVRGGTDVKESEA